MQRHAQFHRRLGGMHRIVPIKGPQQSVRQLARESVLRDVRRDKNQRTVASVLDEAGPEIHPRLGERCSEDGSQAVVGKVLVWEPPERFVISWDLNSNWKPDTTVSSEVEVRFIAQGPLATLVELEHRNFERLGAEAGASMRKDVDGGWPGMLEHFKREAETSSQPTQAAGRAARI